MGDNQQLDVLIAVYLIPDLAQQDFEAYTKLAGDGEIVTDGVALVVKDAEGEVQVQETGDHLGRKGAKAGAGVGLVIGLFAPPLLAATVVGGAVGGLAGKFARHRLQAGIGDKLDDALPRIGRHHRDLRARRGRRRRGRARQCDPYLDRPDRQGLRGGAEGRPEGGIRRTRGLKQHDDPADRGLPDAVVGFEAVGRSNPPTTKRSRRRR